ncbi:MAG: DNA polymerase, partial [Planctomycetaceae bacterium]
MAGRYVFDIETDGLLPELTKLHCIGIKCLDTGKTWSLKAHQWDDQGHSLADGLDFLSRADLLVGHNIIGFDIPAIQKVFPYWHPRGLIRDTLVLTRLLWPHIKDGDFKRAEAGRLPKKLIGKHSLEAWGFRLGDYKGDFNGPWEVWTPEMQQYMDRDVAV